ncbi:amidohydrolase [Halomarina pelagica]|uniref:amidohydrolase n=1 Tax=Halomarina pelagica TaxID=2961599 RepID=UPI0020C38AB0|nr:amidohydrolase [Halomarina sp. BND7]
MSATDATALKRRVCAAIDERRDDLVALAESIAAEPELGFKEVETTRKVVDAFEGLGLDAETEIVVTGARARYGDGPAVGAVLGELDALVNPEHPDADPETGACHACGHHAQIANLVGAAVGLVGADAADELGGAVEFVAVPAEEYLDLDYRRGLVEAGEIEFFGGKQELIRRGYLDDVDFATMIHAGSDVPHREITSDFSTNGFVGKSVTYRGREAHAGAAPEEGVNALNAATLGLNAVHAQRETFRDEDAVRVHPILTRGGDGVNVVPSEARLEAYVRARTVEAVLDANEKVDRALESGAMAVGADVAIEDHPGYLPLRTDPTIVDAHDENVAFVADDVTITEGRPHLAGSTDMGDVTQVLPGIHPWVGGFEGSVHSREFRVVDEEMAYVVPAKVTACTLVDLLTDDAKLAAIREARDAKLSTDEYLDRVRSMRTDSTATYSD